MKDIEELLATIPALSALPDGQGATVAGCGRNAVYEPGTELFREGQRADSFYAIRSGSVALEMVAAPRPPLIIETLHAGDVLGWSWLFPPYRVQFDAKAVDEVHAITFDAECLRAKCDADAELGYALMKRFALVLTDRLQATRVRLLDVYGAPGTGA
jgi:CRP-like cAMP-binding protein